MTLTIAQAKAALPSNMTMRKTDGSEYRVTFTIDAIRAAFPDMTRQEAINKAESMAAYECSTQDALDTANAMHTVGLTDRAARNVQTTIDCTPTWSAVLPLLLAGITDGTTEGQRIARTELQRMAAIADEYNAAIGSK